MTKALALTLFVVAAACNQPTPAQAPSSTSTQGAESPGAATGPIHYETAGTGGSRSSSADPLSPPHSGSGGAH